MLLQPLCYGGVEGNSDLRIIMDKDLKNFLAKVLIIVISIIFLYFIFSPYQICMKAWSYDDSRRMSCLEKTNW